MVFFNTNQGWENGIKQGLDLPDRDEFDEKINLQLTRKQTKETKELFKRKNYYKFVPSTTSFEYLPLKSKKNDPAVFTNLISELFASR